MSKVRDYKVMKLHETFVDCMEHMYQSKDENVVKDYYTFLDKGEYQVSQYFGQYEEPYLELQGWFDNPDAEVRDNGRERGARYANQIFRIVSGELTDKSIKSLHSFGDRKDAETYIKALGDCSTIRTKTAFSKKGVTKTYKNPIKELAWYVVHSYTTDYFLDAKRMNIIMNSIVTPEQIKSWNNYIRIMVDVPENIRTMFIINEKTGTSEFQKSLA